VTLPPAKGDRSSAEYRKKADTELLLKKITSDDYIVLFDEKGETLDSKAFSQKLNQVLLSGKKRIVWIIGGAYGVDDRVKARANLKISFSKMVMNHLVAQTVALEQIYRGFAILKNLPYHNE
jgi:23S rRNA (pseudouridine1915-N3)-methyltransferase